LTIQLNLAGKNIEQQEPRETIDVTYILDEAGLAVVPFYAFGIAQFKLVRLSVGTCKKRRSMMFEKSKLA
jgi:aspartate aminotransferase